MELNISLLLYGLFIGLCAGSLAGLMAGFAGVGGGLVYVPVFYLLMPESHGSVMPSAIFFSMLAIALTAFFSARSHWGLGHVHVRRCIYLCPGLFVGASVGLWSALILPEMWILLGLALLNAWVAYDYGRSFRVSQGGSYAVSSLLGLPIGYISGVFGIAGGTMLVPLLRRSLNLQMAVGTSALCGAVMAVVAVSLNMIAVDDWAQLVRQQWVFLSAACLGVMLTMPYTARKAAAWHDLFPEHKLRGALRIMFVLLSIFFCAAAWF
ncbi:MAG: sulfite exporter TauE/SafE family protein [Mariprofundaceae bacterium]